jgi:hypothetical protein
MSETVEIPRGDWSTYLDAVSRTMEDAELSIEVGSATWAHDVAAERLALQFLAYDGRDALFEVAGASEGSSPPQVYHYLVDAPQRIVVTAPSLTPSRIEVEGANGERAVITLEPRPGTTGAS